MKKPTTDCDDTQDLCRVHEFPTCPDFVDVLPAETSAAGLVVPDPSSLLLPLSFAIRSAMLDPPPVHGAGNQTIDTPIKQEAPARAFTTGDACTDWSTSRSMTRGKA